MVKSIAVIGIGSMGAPMARRLHAAGFELLVCDRNEAALAGFVALGVGTTRRAADCAAADLIIVLVATPEQLREVVLGAEGLKAGLRPGAAPLLAVMGTVLPDSVRALQAALAETGARVVDAPVSGGPVKAERGTLAIMLGGEADDVEAILPAMRSLGTSLFRCGALGSAEATKIVNNVIGIANLIVSAEAYCLAAGQGLELDPMLPVLEASTGRNFFSQNPSDAPDAYAVWAASERDFDSFLAILRKDIALARELAARSGEAFPMLEGLSRTLDRLDRQTFEQWRRVAAMGSGRGEQPNLSKTG